MGSCSALGNTGHSQLSKPRRKNQRVANKTSHTIYVRVYCIAPEGDRGKFIRPSRGFVGVVYSPFSRVFFCRAQGRFVKDCELKKIDGRYIGEKATRPTGIQDAYARESALKDIGADRYRMSTKLRNPESSNIQGVPNNDTFF